MPTHPLSAISTHRQFLLLMWCSFLLLNMPFIEVSQLSRIIYRWDSDRLAFFIITGRIPLCAFVRFSWFHTELFCFYICIITLYIYIHIYIYIYIYIYRSNLEFFTCQFSSMNMFCHVYIYKYQFVLCPFSFEYLHLLILPT